MPATGVKTYPKPLGDLGDAEALDDQRRHLELAGRQRETFTQSCMIERARCRSSRDDQDCLRGAEPSGGYVRATDKIRRTFSTNLRLRVDAPSRAPTTLGAV